MAAIVVVGGGVAGLACAWQLHRRGHAVEVLERAFELGGRLRLQRAGAHALERGATRLRGADTSVAALAAKLGLAPRARPEEVGLLCGGRLHAVDPTRPLGGAPHLSPAARARLLRLAWQLRRQPAPPADAPLSWVGPARSSLAAGGLRLAAGDEAWSRWVEVLLVEAGGQAAAAASDAFALRLLARVRAGLSVWDLEGGAASLSRALAASVPVRAGCEVLSVETEAAGARVRYRARGRVQSVVADAAVVAVPGDRVAALCPKLTPAERGFFERVQLRRALVLHLLLDERPALRATRVVVPHASGGDVAEVCVATDSDAGPRVSVELRGDALETRWDAPAEATEKWLHEELRAAPLRLPRARRALVHRFEAGHAVFGPGQLERLARFADRIERSPRLVFAGDALGGPHVEGAVRSGLQAAASLEAEL